MKRKISETGENHGFSHLPGCVYHSTNGEIMTTRIIGTGSAVPKQVVTNDDLAKIVDTSDEWIRPRTGIRERRIAAAESGTTDLAKRGGENGD